MRRWTLIAAFALTSHIAIGGLGMYVMYSPEDVAVNGYAVLAASSNAVDAATVRTAALRALEDARTRREAAAVLGFVGSPSDADLLWELSVDRDSVVANTAVAALGRVAGEQGITRLLEVAQDPEATTQEAALRALGDLEDPRALAVLRRSLSNPRVSSAAGDGLARNGSAPAVAAVGAAFWRSTDPDDFAEALASFPENSGAREILWRAVDGQATPTFESALRALATAEAPRLFDALVPLLDAPNPSIRIAATDALGALDDPRAVGPLLAHLDGCPGPELHGVLYALKELGGKEVDDKLLELARRESPERAGIIADWLFDDFAEKDVPAMVALARHRRGSVASSVRTDLYGYGWTPGRVPKLVLELARGDLSSTADHGFDLAVSVLIRGAQPADRAFVQDLMFTGTRGQRMRVLSAFEDDPSPEVDAILLGLLDDDDPTVVDAAIGILEDRGPEAQGQLVQSLVDSLGRHRAGSGWGTAEAALARIGGPRGTRALLDQVRSGTRDERDNAIRALVGSGTPGHLDALQDIVGSLGSEGRTAVLVASLGSGNAPRPMVVDRVGDDDPDIAVAAMDALAGSDGPQAVAVLSTVLNDLDRSVTHREGALSAIAAAGPENLASILIGVLDDEELAGSALSHLSELGTDRAGRAIDEVAMYHANPEMRVAALQAVSYSGVTSDELGLYTRALEDDDDTVVGAGFDGLVGLGTSVAARLLLQVALEDDLGSARAAEALERMGGALAEENVGLLTDLQEEAGEDLW